MHLRSHRYDPKQHPKQPDPVPSPNRKPSSRSTYLWGDLCVPQSHPNPAPTPCLLLPVCPTKVPEPSLSPASPERSPLPPQSTQGCEGTLKSPWRQEPKSQVQGWVFLAERVRESSGTPTSHIEEPGFESRLCF